MDSFAAELMVEEMYASSGDDLEMGDRVLKLTSDSYQNALDYYEAAILRADNSLTDTQLEYDQGILETQYTYEMAVADSENAEFIRQYQINEVASAISDHEKVLEEIEEKITELETGIASGSYETASASSSGGGSSGGGSSGDDSSGGSTGGASDGNSEEISDKDSDEAPEENTDIVSEENSKTESDEFSDGASEESNPEESNPEGNKPEESNPEEGNPEEGNPEESNLEESKSDDSEPDENQKEQEKIEEFRLKASEAEALAEKITNELQEVSEKLENSTDSSNSEDYATYANQLNNIINEMAADIEVQKNVQSILTEKEDEATAAALDASVQGNTRVLESLEDIQVRLNKYQSIISFALGILDTGSDMVAVDVGFLSDISAYLVLQQECSSICNELIEIYEQELRETESDSQNTNEQKNESAFSEEDEKTGNNSTSGSGMSGSSGAGSGSLAGSISGSRGMASGEGAGGAQVISAQITGIQTTGVQTGGISGQSALSGKDISLLGDTYDLTTVQNLLSRNPSDSDAAQELIEELQDSQEEVQMQYAELQRKEKIFELEIQHTYDTAVINAKLAEFTYQQEMEAWEETLAEAKQTKAELEEQKALLDSMEDGIITADRDGTVAAVSYEAEDIISSTIPVISYYDTDAVTVTLEIGQEDISRVAVGDTVEVTLGGFAKYEGVVTEKSVEMEPEPEYSIS